MKTSADWLAAQCSMQQKHISKRPKCHVQFEQENWETQYKEIICGRSISSSSFIPVSITQTLQHWSKISLDFKVLLAIAHIYKCFIAVPNMS
jgi:hypothetical protein